MMAGMLPLPYYQLHGTKKCRFIGIVTGFIKGNLA